MATLLEVQKAADELSGLGPDDDEIDRREIEMDSGVVRALNHDEFLSAVGRQ